MGVHLAEQDVVVLVQIDNRTPDAGPIIENVKPKLALRLIPTVVADIKPWFPCDEIRCCRFILRGIQDNATSHGWDEIS
ncbi:hypothetical protein DTL42_02425 [Bremerella cremea]|uniref:Uncharacterized protein n=1 Tax=Bremerella cremea TaxID=1031537 RepID=A0A368KUC8_9BACT|nr:hypothetical protein DTL42_02425 [Bremerella cremea]